MPSSGLSQMRRRQLRRTRAISRASSSGSPRSQPSERIRRTGPFRMTLRAHRVLKVCSASPMRVPPPQSVTSRMISFNGACDRAIRRVIRVNSVENTNASR